MPIITQKATGLRGSLFLGASVTSIPTNYKNEIPYYYSSVREDYSPAPFTITLLLPHGIYFCSMLGGKCSLDGGNIPLLMSTFHPKQKVFYVVSHSSQSIIIIVLVVTDRTCGKQKNMHVV